MPVRLRRASRMVMPQASRLWTRDEVLALYELRSRGFGIPRLAVEILSPSTARSDRIVKRQRYQQAGVATYWIVDLDAGVVEVWRPPDEVPVIEHRALHWQPDSGVAPLDVDLGRFSKPEWVGNGGS